MTCAARIFTTAWLSWTREGNSGRIIIVRNHEGRRWHALPEQTLDYIPWRRRRRHHQSDLRSGAESWAKDWSTLAGTNRNCAGGVTPWGTWITGEETGDAGHGWAFDVGAQKGDPTPLKAMGRFSHEAMMVNHDAGYVYATEDATPSGFYKFIPYEYGNLKLGGELYMLRVLNGPPNDDFGPLGVIGQTWNVQWVPRRRS